MQKKLTISIDEQIYNALYHIVGKRKISRFIENLVKPEVINEALELAYKQMSEDSSREEEALQWTEGTFEEFHDETW
jgi:predicted CopG family antitoxin|tara:strand:+ start:7664 stop:7894 length:231 start_codon:yes stop_codon:yes gene_type:complete